MFAYAGREFRIVFLSIVRTRHIVEELCKIKIFNTDLTLRSPLELTSSSPEDTDEVEASLFNFVDLGFITSIPCFIINFCWTLYLYWIKSTSITSISLLLEFLTMLLETCVLCYYFRSCVDQHSDVARA